MKPSYLSVLQGIYVDGEVVTMQIHGATKGCIKHLELSIPDALRLSQQINDDVLRAMKVKLIEGKD